MNLETGESQEFIELSVFSKTCKGIGRVQNQDSLLAQEYLSGHFDSVLLVADGIGGNAGGAIASRSVSESIRKALSCFQISGERNAFDTPLFIENLVRQANQKVLKRQLESSDISNMGTTLTIVLQSNSEIFIGHIGDSRAYLYRDKQLVQLTTDHTWISEQITAGNLSDTHAKTHQNRNLLTRAIGINSHPDIQQASLTICDGDIVMVCSDGISSFLDENKIKSILSVEKPDSMVNKLIETAQICGSADDATAVIGIAQRSK